MLFDLINKQWRRITLGLILLLCIALSILACRRWFSSNTNTGSGGSSTRTQQPDPPAPEQENFRGVNVAPKQILIKLSNCSGVDTSKLETALTEFSQRVTDDSGIVASRATNTCWFLIKSSTLPVPTLMQRFNEAISNKRRLVIDNLTATVVHAEPNFHFQVNRLPLDPIDDYAAASPTPPPSASPSPLPTTSPVPTVTPNDLQFRDNKLWGLKNLISLGVDIHAENAWGFSTGNDKIVVGVIDTGIDYSHPDLSNNVWSAPSNFTVTVGGTAIPCPAGSHGFNAITSNPAQMCDPSDNSLVSGHGTHVAGIIGAVGNNGVGVVGVNWMIKLLGLKTMGDSGTATSLNIHRAIEFAVQLREVLGDDDAYVRVLNASFGYLDSVSDPDFNSLLLSEGIELAGGKEMLFVASAGENNGNDNDAIHHYPSGYRLANVLSVTAINKFGDLATISGSDANHGKASVHLGAPGKGIYSTYPPSLGDSYYSSSGTSMATPFVSGAAALMLSVSNCSGLSASDLKRLIIAGVDKTSSLSQTVSEGRLNVFESIKRCPNGP